MTRSPMLAKVHIAKKDLRLSDDDYRAILTRVTGQSSSAGCTDKQLDAVLGEFKRLGWKPKKAASGKPSAHAHVRHIFALWHQLEKLGALTNPSRQALCAFCERQTGVSIPDWLTSAQANKVAEALKAMIKRAGETA